MFSSFSPSLLLLSLPFLLHVSHSFSPPKRLPERFLGKFELEDYNGWPAFDKFTSELGFSWIMRRIIYSLYPHITISQNGERLVTLLLAASVYTFNEEFFLDSAKAKCDGEKVIFDYKGDVS